MDRKLHQALIDTERLGELFLNARKAKVEADKQRQSLREALTALRKGSQASSQGSVYLLRPGGVLAKFSLPSAVATLEQGTSTTHALSPHAPSCMNLHTPLSLPLPCFVLCSSSCFPGPADQKEVEARLESLGVEEKRLLARLSEKGALPESLGPGMLNAMLNLRGGDKKGHRSLVEEL
jgi:hypothetical protein